MSFVYYIIILLFSCAVFMHGVSAMISVAVVLLLYVLSHILSTKRVHTMFPLTYVSLLEYCLYIYLWYLFERIVVLYALLTVSEGLCVVHKEICTSLKYAARIVRISHRYATVLPIHL